MKGPVDPRLLKHSRTSRGGVLLLGVLGLGQALATVTVIVALSRIVVMLFENSSIMDAFSLRSADLLMLAGGFLGRALLTWAEQVLAQRTAARVAEELRAAVLAASLRRGPAWVAEFGSGRLTALLTGGMDALRPWFAGYLPALVLAVTLPPLVVAIMALVDPASALIAVLTLPLIPVFGALVGRATQRRAEERWAASARLSGHFLDVVRGLATLRLYGRAERQIPVVQQMTERHRAATVRVLRIAFLSSTALDLVATLSVGLIAVEAGLRVAAGDLDLGPALLVILLAPEAYRPLREVGARFHAGADAGAVITEVDAVLTEPAVSPITFADPAGPPSIRLAGVRVRHPQSAVEALALPALRLDGGDLAALRGPSGAGKTTTLRVLAGLQAPTTGSVEVGGGRPLYLPQRPVLPHARTILEALADDMESGEEAEGWAALAVVGLADEVAAMPEGLRTAIGEHGRGLSSGQRQRLALAKVLRAARRRPAVLLLDEPTAHLDPATEQLVIAELRAAADRGCAVLVVAHRPALLAAVTRTIPITPPLLAVDLGQGVRRVGVTPTNLSRSPSGRASSASGSASGAGRAVVAVGLGVGAWLAGVTLTAAAAWLLVRAASLPPVLSLSAAVVMVRGSAVARPLLRYLERLAAHEVGFARLGIWRAQVYADLIPRTPGAGLRRRGELLSRIVEDVDLRVDGLLRGRLPAASALVALVVTVAAATLVLPLTAMVLVPALLLGAVVAPVLAARQASRLEDGSARARAELADAMVETVDGIEELIGRGQAALRIPVHRGQALARIEAGAARSAGAAAAIAHLAMGLAVLGMALLVAGTAGQRSGAGTGPELGAVLLLGVLTLTEPLLTLPDAAVARHRAGRAVARLEALCELPASPTHRPATENSSATGIVVRGLVAGWDPARPPALDGIDLELRAGGRIAVLGASGVGKSTLAAVLAGLLEPRAGTVTGVGRVAMVGDEVDHIFASTVRENLRLARKNASDDALREMLAEVRLADWLAGLPHGLDTWLGEGGTTMSGGERRRLVTARALLAEPDLLILDEPTEGLDEPTAQALMADLLAAASGRRVLLLTHRTEGLDQVDAIYQLRSPGLDLTGDRVGQPGRRRQAQPGGHEQADHLGGQQLGPALDGVLVAQVAVLGGPADH